MPFAAQTLKSARLHLQKRDPVMKAIIKRVGPCQIKTRRCRFRTLAASIVSQQISTAAARTVWQRLEQAVAPQRVTADSVIGLGMSNLRNCGISRQKSSYLLDLAEKNRQGVIDFRRFAQLTDEQVIDELTRVKGIGRWTAQMFLMFTLCRPDVFPVDDLGIKNAIRAAYALAESPPRERMLQIGQPWQPYSTMASWYLWRSLDLETPI